MTLRQLSLICLLQLGIMMLSVWPQPASALEKVSLQLKWTHQFQFAGYYAAKEQGFYEDEGLDVEFHEFSAQHPIVNQVVNGDADFGISDSTLLADFVNGRPVVALAAIFQENPMVLFTKKSSGIVTPNDIIGKKVMFDVIDMGGAVITAMLAANGLKPNQYTFLQHDYNERGLLDDKVDVISGYLTDDPYFFKKHNMPVNIIKPQNYGINVYGDILFTSQKKLKQEPELVEKFRRASLKGWQYAISHSDEMIALIKSKYKPSLGEDELAFEAQETIALMKYPIIEVGHMHLQRWQHVAALYQQQGLIHKDVDFDAFIYSPKSKTYFYLVPFLALLIALLFFWIFRNYYHQYKLTKNLQRLDLAFGTAKQGWFDHNIQTGAIAVSDEYSRLLGYKPKDFNTNFEDWQKNIHPDDKDRVLASLEQWLESGGPVEAEYRRRTKDGNWKWLHTVGQVIEWDKKGNPIRGIGVQTDITQRKKADLRDEFYRYVMEQLVRDEPLTSILNTIVIAVESEISNAVCSILLLDKEGKRLFIAAAPNMPDFYNEAINGIEVGIGVGNCGTAAYTQKRVIVEDIQTHPYWAPYKELAAQANLASAWSEPIFGANAKILGTFSIYHPHAIHPSAEDFKSLEFAANLAAIVIERSQTAEQLKLSSRVFSDTREGITITNASKEIIDVNPAFCDITGYSREEVIGQTPSLLGSGKQGPEFYARAWKEIDEHGHWQGEVWNRRKSGELYAQLLTISSLFDDNGNVINYVGMFTDITQSKEQQEKLSLMAHYDVLTSLPNRTLFSDRFHQAIAHSKRTHAQLAVCFLDLDNFKPVNDNFGHDVGDKLLIEVAGRIKSCIRDEDTVSRQGGDEFAILLNDIESSHQCELLLQRLHQSLAQPYLIEGQTHRISASSGITLYPDDDSDIDTLLRHADQAMYQSKQAGRNRYHLFNAKRDQETTLKHLHLDEIEHALINHEFSLYYQPKVNMVSGEVFGFEALIRWHHPEKGLIPPLDFLPLIDGTDLELEVGDWVINQGLKQLDIWLGQDIKLEVSVNIASHHLQSTAFFTRLEAALARYPAVDSKQLQLEILESSALSDLQTISNIIRTCQDALGVSIALDDFGTSYSSLTHLRTLRTDTIKIDQSFVRDMLDDPSDYTIIDGVVGLAESFNRDVIAEGVETTQHGLMLLLMGCVRAQGYSISRPMPAQDIPIWLANYRPNVAWTSLGNQSRTVRENKIKLFRLITEHWMAFFVNNILSSPAKITHWPIMDKGRDHGGQWIKRARKENLFEPDELNLLAQVHDEFHDLSQELLEQYQNGQLDAARDGLPKLHLAFDEMRNVLGRCQ